LSRNRPLKRLTRRDIVVERQPVPPQASEFDLNLVVEQRADGLHVTAEYDAHLFEPSTVQRLLEHYQVGLSCVVADPTLAIDRVGLISPGERERLLHEPNNT